MSGAFVAILAVSELPLLATFVGIGFATGKWGYALGAAVGIATIAAVIFAVQFMRAAR